MEYILRALCGVLPNREMTSIIVAHLTFSDVSDRDSAIYLDEPVSVVRSFESELRKKETAALRDIIPRHKFQVRSLVSQASCSSSHRRERTDCC